jgi:uncharacterized protein (UPF0262 family)
MAEDRQRLIEVTIDESSLAAASADAEHERRVAIFDLLEQNVFALEGDESGPYTLRISIIEQRLVLDVAKADGAPARAIVLSLTPFRRVIKDYFIVCDSYYEAIRHATPAQIEAIDMGRRGLHNEGSQLLQERLAGRVNLDFDTARRLFTLICALHVRG